MIPQQKLTPSEHTIQVPSHTVSSPQITPVQTQTMPVIQVSSQTCQIDTEKMNKFIKDIQYTQVLLRKLHKQQSQYNNADNIQEHPLYRAVKQYKQIQDKDIKQLAEVGTAFFVQAVSKIRKTQPKLSMHASQQKYEEIIKFSIDMAIQYGLYRIFVEHDVKSVEFFRYFMSSSQDTAEDVLNQTIQESLQQMSDDLIRGRIADLKKRIKQEDSYKYKFTHNIESAILYNYSRLKHLTQAQKLNIQKYKKRVQQMKLKMKPIVFEVEKQNIASYQKAIVMFSLGKMYTTKQCLNQLLTVKRPMKYMKPQGKCKQQKMSLKLEQGAEVLELIQPTQQNYEKFIMLLLEKLKGQNVKEEAIWAIKNQIWPEQSNDSQKQQNIQFEQQRPQQISEKQIRISKSIFIDSKIQSESQKKRTYIQKTQKKILQIDGGGIKGIVALFYLAELQFRTCKKVYEMFDFFVGTSIGGLICLVFAMKKYSAREMLVLMLGLSKNRIFPGGYLKLIQNLCFYHAFYKQEEIQKFLMQLCLAENNKQFTLAHPQKTLDFMITTCTYSTFPNQNKITPHVFYKYTNQYGQIQKGLMEVKVQENGNIDFLQKSEIFQKVQYWKILRATSAAFPYFRPVVINQEKFYDGGFMFNTPSMLACKFLQLRNVKSQNFFMLSIGLEKPNPYEYDQFDLKEVHNKMSDLINQNSIKSMAINKDFIGKSMNNTTYYCNQETFHYLGSNIVRLQPIQRLQVDLNKNDYSSMNKMLRIAQITMLNIDLNGIIHNLALQDSKYEEGISIARHFPRSILYENEGSYKSLNEMFDQNGQCQQTQYNIQKFQEIFSDFKFPQNLDKSQKRNNSPFSLATHGISFLLTEALTYGHYKSIMKFQKQDGFDNLKSLWGWNCYHIAIANDEVLSVHLINRKYLNLVKKQSDLNPVYDKFLRITLNNALAHEQTLLSLQKIKQKISNEKCNYSFLYWKNKPAKQFIFDYSSKDIKRYMNRLVKYLRDKDFQFTWNQPEEVDRRFWKNLLAEVIRQAILLFL